MKKLKNTSKNVKIKNYNKIVVNFKNNVFIVRVKNVWDKRQHRNVLTSTRKKYLDIVNKTDIVIK